MIRAGAIGIIIVLSVAMSGCVSLFIKPYGYVSADAEKIRPDSRPVYMPYNASSISQGYKPKRLKAPGNAHSGHEGIDVIDRSGTSVIAAAPGVVTGSYFELFFGRRVEIAHGVDEEGMPVMSRYFHLSERLVEKGDVVVRGQPIGTMGRSGLLAGGILHLHYEIRVGSGLNNSVNPHKFWADGVGVVTCFDKNRKWHDLPFNTTYPVPCREAASE